MPVALAGLALTCAIGLTACSSGASDQKFESINDFAKTYEKAASVECSESRLDMRTSNWTQTGCGPHTVVMIFTSDEKREEIKENNPLKSGQVWLQGGNWLVAAAQYEAEAANKSLKGELIAR